MWFPILASIFWVIGLNHITLVILWAMYGMGMLGEWV
jgi:hypothetical protein